MQILNNQYIFKKEGVANLSNQMIFPAVLPSDRKDIHRHLPEIPYGNGQWCCNPMLLSGKQPHKVNIASVCRFNLSG